MKCDSGLAMYDTRLAITSGCAMGMFMGMFNLCNTGQGDDPE